MTPAPDAGDGGVGFHTSEFQPGQLVFAQGDPGDRVYLITEGKVKISFDGSDGRTSVRAIIGAGDIFGELAVFDPEPRACTATAITDVRAVWLDRATLRAWMAQRPAIAEQLLQALTRRIRDTEEHIIELISSDVAARVAHQLLLLARRFGTPEGDAVRIALTLSQDEMAQLVGADRVSVNKALRTFTARAWILVEGKTILILDPDALARRAGIGDRPGSDPNRRRRPLRATA